MKKLFIIPLSLLFIIGLAETASAKYSYSVNEIVNICSDRAEKQTTKEFKKRFKKRAKEKFGVLIAWNGDWSVKMYQKASALANAELGDSFDIDLYMQLHDEYLDDLILKSNRFIYNHWPKYVIKKANNIDKYRNKKIDKCGDKFILRYKKGLIDITE